MIFQEVLKDVGDVGQSKTESGRACGAEGTEEERCQVTSVQVDRHGNTVRLDSAECYFQVGAGPQCQLRNVVLLFCHYPRGKEVRGKRSGCPLEG